MSSVSEWIVREYFETLGFLVTQPRKYSVSARPKQAGEEIDLVVVNPAAKEHMVPDQVLWSVDHIRHISRAVVGVRGWHTDRFTPSVIEASPEVFRFAEPESMGQVASALGEGPIAKILCLPAVTSTDELQDRTLQMIRDRGVDGVILFPTMLRELIASVDVNRNYEKSDILQLLRILKNYGLIKGPQMELFGAGTGKN